VSDYEPVVDEGTLYLVGADERVEIGTVDHVVDAVGGETYEIEYDEQQRAQPWLDLDDAVLEIDVRDAVTSMGHTAELVGRLREYGMDTDRYGLPTRTIKFADEFVDILEEYGVSDEG
jgi:hypothetical protein